MTGRRAMPYFSVETGSSPGFMVHGSWVPGLHRNAAGAFQCRPPAWTADEPAVVDMLHRQRSAVEVCGGRVILAFWYPPSISPHELGSTETCPRSAPPNQGRKWGTEKVTRVGLAAPSIKAEAPHPLVPFPRRETQIAERALGSRRPRAGPHGCIARAQAAGDSLQMHPHATPGETGWACLRAGPGQKPHAGIGRGEIQKEPWKAERAWEDSRLPPCHGLCEAKLVSKPVSNTVITHPTGESWKMRVILFACSFLCLAAYLKSREPR